MRNYNNYEYEKMKHELYMIKRKLGMGHIYFPYTERERDLYYAKLLFDDVMEHKAHNDNGKTLCKLLDSIDNAYTLLDKYNLNINLNDLFNDSVVGDLIGYFFMKDNALHKCLLNIKLKLGYFSNNEKHNMAQFLCDSYPILTIVRNVTDINVSDLLDIVSIDTILDTLTLEALNVAKCISDNDSITLSDLHKFSDDEAIKLYLNAISVLSEVKVLCEAE